MDLASFWAMVDAARTASQEHVYRQLERAAAELGERQLPAIAGHRRMEQLAAGLGELPLPEVVGDLWMQPAEGRLGDLGSRPVEWWK